MIPVRGYDGKRVAVLGLGRSGLATAAALRAGGAEALCWDDSDTARAKAEDAGCKIHDLTRAQAFEGVEALITSPGIAHLYPKPNPVIARAMAAGVVVDNDIGLFFRSFATEDWDHYDVMPRVVAVTGSNGKSTTSALIHHLLKSAGRPTQLAGNIGRGVLDLEPAGDGEVIVLELSSYQTELARSLTPDIAVFTNLSPDHLDRHGGKGGYFAAKRRLFAEGGPDRAVIGVDQPEGVFLASQLAQAAEDERVIRISTSGKVGFGWSVVARKGFIAETRKGRQIASFDMRGLANLSGVHNQQNAACAWAVLRSLGAGPRQIEDGMKSFAGLDHRGQLIAEIKGVKFINDSKATNVDAARFALMAHPRIRWIAGGQVKEGGVGDLGDALGAVAKSYVIGSDPAPFLDLLGNREHIVCGDMATAVAKAFAEAEAGDTILLAPAAASFDQYTDFEARGRDFVNLVKALQ